MLKSMFLKEPIQKNNVSPLMYVVTARSDGREFSGMAWELHKFDSMLGEKAHLLNRYDRYDSEDWKDPTDDEDDHFCLKCIMGEHED